MRAGIIHVFSLHVSLKRYDKCLHQYEKLISKTSDQRLLWNILTTNEKHFKDDKSPIISPSIFACSLPQIKKKIKTFLENLFYIWFCSNKPTGLGAIRYSCRSYHTYHEPSAFLILSQKCKNSHILTEIQLEKERSSWLVWYDLHQ